MSETHSDRPTTTSRNRAAGDAAGPALDTTPIPDALDQQHPAGPDPEVDPPDEDIDLTTLEADPADVVDQHRDAPVLGDDEPWP